MNTCRPFVFITLALLPVSVAAQEPEPLGEEFQVNTLATGRQLYPDVTSDPSGRFVVVWQTDPAGTFSSYDVRGQRFDASGNPRGEEFQVNAQTGGTQYQPAIDSTATGGFVVAWMKDAGISARRFDVDGLPLGTEIQVISSGRHPEVAVDPEGAFTIVWDRFSQGIFGQRYEADGDPSGAQFRVNTTNLHYAYYGPASIASNPEGDFLVVWGNRDGSERGVFGQLFDRTGVALGGEFRVNTSTYSIQRFPTVAATADTGFVVTWESQHASYNPGIFGQRYDAAGSSLGSEFQVNTSGSSATRSSIAADAAGNFTVTWQAGGVFGRAFDAFGNPLGGEFPIGAPGARARIAADADGDLVVTWDRANEIFARRYAGPGLTLAADGSCPGPVTIDIVNAPPGTEVAVVAAANTNGFIKGAALCPGTQLEIGEPFQLPPRFVIVDGNGNGSTNLTLGGNRCHIQALALASCETSNVVVVP